MKPTAQTTTQSTAPWGEAVPALRSIIGNAHMLYGQTSPSPNWATSASNKVRTDMAVAGDPNIKGAQAALGGLLTDNEPGAAETYLTPTARGDNLNTPNPYLEQQIADQSSKIVDSLKSMYSAGGRYGSATMNRDAADRLGVLRGGILSTNWENERNRQLEAAGALESAQQGRAGLKMGAIGMVPTLSDARFNDMRELSSVGAAQEALPWQRLQNLTNIVGAAGGGGGSTTTTEPGPSVLSKILSGASGIGSLLGAFGLSDERAKKDVEPMGKTPGGSNVYAFRYKDEPSAGGLHMGVMAQEERRRNPKAVKRLPGGLLAVDYSKVA